ncbi:MAG: aroA, partial [Gammaproteobacteria bacterium]|nr:aroA [Gammaproteobacteria bacterium]
MHVHVHNTKKLRGILAPPSSKSQNIRGIVFAALASGECTLLNPLTSDDTSDALRIAQSLGIHIKFHDRSITLSGAGIPFQTTTEYFYSGNSGLTTLFSLPLLGLRDQPHIPVIFDCGDQMRARPIAPLVRALNQLGMDIRYLKEKEKCPLTVSGHLLGGKTMVDGLNSQYLSALLISLPCAPKDSEIHIQNLHERPYIEMTLSWLKKHSINYTHNQFNDTDVFHIPGNQHYSPFQAHIPGDFSSASCIIAAATL